MVNLISIGKIDKYFIYPIIGGIIPNFIALIYKNEPDFSSYFFILCILSGFSMCFSFIPYLISKKYSKIIVKSYDNINKKQLRIKKIGFVLISTLIDVTESIIRSLSLTEQKFDYWIIDIILIHVFSYYILKTRLYKHHYLSIIIVLIINCILYIFQLKYEDWTLKKMIIDLLFEVLLMLTFVINKYNMDYQYCSPYELCFYIGSLSTLIYSILFIFFSLYDEIYMNQLFIFFNKFDLRFFFIVCGFLILTFFGNICFFLTNKYLNPFYILIILLIRKIVANFFNQKDMKFLVKFFALFIVFLSILIFNEIIILNFCGLEKNIKRNLEERANIEILKNMNNDDEIRYSTTSNYQVDIDGFQFKFEKTLNMENLDIKK